VTRWFALLLLVLLGSCAPSGDVRTLTMAEYESKVAGFWLGQLVGNIYGLSHEFQYLDEPGPDTFPLGYGTALDRAIEVGGAFSDDDTDLEYMYLLQMEQHGVEPTYGQLTEAWKYHIRDRIWAANRVALTLMHHGYNPPATGSQANNPRWFEIDPQLVNEIWAVTAPGMTDYAVQKTAWAARITNDDFGIEPALFYAALISEGFFESDIPTLIEFGKSKLPAEGRFRGVIDEMQALHASHPDDWKAARAELAARYGGRQSYNEYGWEPIDATLNGAAAVLALLYGQGDIQRTLDLACSMGWDADNQAATLTGLLGLIHGADALPDALLRPVPGWEKPFNDRYVNVSRHDLPDASIEDQIRRLVAQGIRVVESRGGSRVSMDGVPTLFVERETVFQPPRELLAPPMQILQIGDSFDVSVYDAGAGFELAADRPDWVERNGNRLAGRATQAGYHEVLLFWEGTQPAWPFSCWRRTRRPRRLRCWVPHRELSWSCCVTGTCAPRYSTVSRHPNPNGIITAMPGTNPKPSRRLPTRWDSRGKNGAGSGRPGWRYCLAMDPGKRHPGKSAFLSRPTGHPSTCSRGS
jgi:hypothetical protein